MVDFPDHPLYDKVNQQFGSFPRQTRIQFGFFFEIIEEGGQRFMKKSLMLREIEKCRSGMKTDDFQQLIPLCKELEVAAPEFADKIKEIREILEENISLSGEALEQKQMNLAEQSIAGDNEMFGILTRIMGPTTNANILKLRQQRSEK